MELSQFKIRSFIIGIIALGLLITLVSFGISQIYKTFVKSPQDKAAIVISTTPLPGTSPRSSTTPGKSPTPNPKQTPAPSATPTPASSGTNVANQPTTGSDELEIRNPGISIDNVQAGDTVNTGITISGRANVTNTKVVIEIKDNDGKVLGAGNTTGCIGYDACPFSTTINFEKAQSKTGILFAYNPGDNGTRLYEVQIPVNF